ncbi:MAG: Wadjet anti-phage system protein JetD domain-containing protein [Chitinophagaceae bacterium]
MITPAEIKVQALKWWKPYLQSHLKGEMFFPRNIDRIGKIKSSAVRENLSELQTQLDDLYKKTKEKTGFGYVVNKEDVHFRRTGSHTLPQSITFESAEDYIVFVGKKKEWNSFLYGTNVIEDELPQLKEWVLNNPQAVIDYDGEWVSLMNICKYFLVNPKPDLYLRQLPIDLHTKFIEQHDVILKSLLDFLIRDNIRDASEKSISKRYHLKYDEPTIRIRILDKLLMIGGLSDIRIPLSDFEKLEIHADNLIVTENKMNFLALPALPATIAIWSGGGFMISHLQKVRWLHNRNILYWGDLDTHGFLILHQMRTYFTQTKSVMMDMETFERFKGEGVVAGEKINSEKLTALDKTETKMFEFLRTNNLRLEQEKIRQEHADIFFQKLFPIS